MLPLRPMQAFIVCSLLTIMLCGCGGGADDSLVHVKGTAVLDGQPIVYGIVNFAPNAAKEHSGPQGSAIIRDGKFDSSTGGGQVRKGPHIARVTAYDSEPQIPATEDETKAAEIPMPAPLCSSYPVEVDIQTEELKIEVPKEAITTGQQGRRGETPPPP